jgi:hypothetical protein
MKNAERRLQLTSKFVQMGKALVEEGKNSGDLIIAQLGTMIIFIGGICFDDEDVIRFGDLVSMYSAKKLIESMEENEDPILMDIRKKADEDTYENILEGVNDLINNAKSGKLDDDDEDDDDEDENDKLKK